MFQVTTWIRQATIASFLAVGCGLTTGVAAQAYPERPVRVIVPVGAGSGFDVSARLIAEQLARKSGQPFVVENMPGAGTTRGVVALSHASPDGYTIGMVLSPATVQQSLIKNLGVDTRKDLAPIILLGWDFNVLVVNPSVPAKTVADLVATLKTNPGKLNFASGGNGTPAHIAGEFFKQSTKTDMVHVPYKSANEAVKDLLAGRVHVMFGNVPATLPHIQAGTLRALAIVGKQRLAQLPDVPSIAEAGFPDIDVPNWTAIMAPAGTPPAIVAYLEREIGEAMKQATVRDRMTRFATVIDVQGPDALGKLINNDVARWAEVVRAANIKGDE